MAERITNRSNRELKILFLSPEAAPFAKSGGLADVAGALPVALNRLGVDVRLVLPYYRIIRENKIKSRLRTKGLEIPLGDETLRADIYEALLHEKIPVYLIEREDMYDRQDLYGTSGEDYYDNIERFSFYCHGVLAIAMYIDFRPDVIHCHDWQTGLLPALLKGPYKDKDFFSSTSSVFTIHNLGYQGIFPKSKMEVTGLSSLDFFHPKGLEFWGNINLLKAGIVFSDTITTVSPSYAEEIQTREYGMGLEGVLQERRSSFHGILNGVDYERWDPARDGNIKFNYSPERMEGKKKCKEFLLKEMNLDPGLMDRPLIGMVSRLDSQKGMDLVIRVLDRLFKQDTGLVILGAGDDKLERSLKSALERHKSRMGIYIGLNESLSHRIMAGADIFLIPSRYEPCGLTQMYALKYGTVPVVRATGGLNDTIISYEEDDRNANGFKFGRYEQNAFYKALEQAMSAYGDKRLWNRLVINGMKADFSWDTSAKEYLRIYESLMV